MGISMHVFTWQKLFIALLAEKLLLQIFLFSNRALRALSRLPTCASLKQRKLEMQPGKRRSPLVSLSYNFKI